MLVTGGGSGIGAAVVARLAGAGARVTLTGRRSDRVEAVAAAAGPGALAVPGDVTDPRDRQRMVDAAVAHGGGLELLVHGAANMYRGPLQDLDEKQLVEVFTSNTIAPIMLTGLALPHLRERRGAVVFFGAAHTQRAFPGASPTRRRRALRPHRGARDRAGPAGRAGELCRPGGVLTEIGNERVSSPTPGPPSGCRGHGSARPGPERHAGLVAEAVQCLARAEWATRSVSRSWRSRSGVTNAWRSARRRAAARASGLGTPRTPALRRNVPQVRRGRRAAGTGPGRRSELLEVLRSNFRDGVHGDVVARTDTTSTTAGSRERPTRHR